jgi:hypothetical protein
VSDGSGRNRSARGPERTVRPCRRRRANSSRVVMRQTGVDPEGPATLAPGRSGREAMASLAAAALDDGLAGPVGHAMTEAVPTGPTAVVGLERAFHAVPPRPAGPEGSGCRNDCARTIGPGPGELGETAGGAMARRWVPESEIPVRNPETVDAGTETGQLRPSDPTTVSAAPRSRVWTTRAKSPGKSGVNCTNVDRFVPLRDAGTRVLGSRDSPGNRRGVATVAGLAAVSATPFDARPNEDCRPFSTGVDRTVEHGRPRKA